MANQVNYGFYNLKDLFGQRATTINQDTISTAIDATLAEHERQLSSLVDLFTRRTTLSSLRYRSVSGGRLQPLSEIGRALPTKRAGYYTVGWPIQDAGDAFGADFVTLVKMTVGEINDWLSESMIKDKRWMRDHILAALFTNVNWTYPDGLAGDVVVTPLANGDSQVYQITSGADTGATAQHFAAQAAGIADATNPYPAMRNLLLDKAENGGQVVALIPTGLRATTEALATFTVRADPNITPGNASDRLTGALGIATPGPVIGYETSGVWIVEWSSMPANYIIAVATEGQRPLAMREHAEPELQGFRRVAERNNYPWFESQYVRRAGFGAWNRVGAAVTRIGNASYAIPTTPPYTAPMP